MAQKSSDGRRVLRFEKSLRQELAGYLLTGFKRELDGIVSISRLIATKDFRNAKVFVTVMGSEAEQKSSVETLNDYRHEIQQHIAHAMSLRFTPRLTFLIDETAEKMLKVERILMDLHKPL